MSQSPSKRPAAQTMVRIDPSNPYAELGVSPLASIEEIGARASKRRGELLARRRQNADGRLAAAEEAQVIRLQELEKKLGSARGRAEYDQNNPLAALLTVQPGTRDLLLDPQRRADLVSAWLVEALAPEAVLPSPHSGWLGIGAPLDTELAALLELHLADADTAHAKAVPADPDSPLSLHGPSLTNAAPLGVQELHQISADAQSAEKTQR